MPAGRYGFCQSGRFSAHHQIPFTLRMIPVSNQFPRVEEIDQGAQLSIEVWRPASISHRGLSGRPRCTGCPLTSAVRHQRHPHRLPLTQQHGSAERPLTRRSGKRVCRRPEWRGQCISSRAPDPVSGSNGSGRPADQPAGRSVRTTLRPARPVRRGRHADPTAPSCSSV